MNKLVVLKVAALLLFFTVTLFAKKTEESSHQSFTAASYRRVEVENVNGKITSSVSKDANISVTFTKWAQHPAGKKVDLNEIEIKVDENTSDKTLQITIELPDKYAENVSYGCDIELAMPEDLYTDLSTINGAISASGHEAGLKLTTTNGAIEISETSGDAEFATTNGAVKIAVHSGNITGTTTNGIITANVHMPDRDGICRLETVNGVLKVTVPETVDAELTMSTVHGGIFIDGEKIKVTVLDHHEIHETFGDGSGIIELSTINGVISLDRL